MFASRFYMTVTIVLLLLVLSRCGNPSSDEYQLCIRNNSDKAIVIILSTYGPIRSEMGAFKPTTRLEYKYMLEDNVAYPHSDYYFSCSAGYMCDTDTLYLAAFLLDDVNEMPREEFERVWPIIYEWKLSVHDYAGGWSLTYPPE